MNRVMALDRSGATVFRVAYEGKSVPSPVSPAALIISYAVVFEGKGAPVTSATSKSPVTITQPAKTPQKPRQITDEEMLNAEIDLLLPSSNKSTYTPTPSSKKRAVEKAYTTPGRDKKMKKITVDITTEDEDLEVEEQIIKDLNKETQGDDFEEEVEKHVKRPLRSGKKPRNK
jgi:hypothetical protein